MMAPRACLCIGTALGEATTGSRLVPEEGAAMTREGRYETDTTYKPALRLYWAAKHPTQGLSFTPSLSRWHAPPLPLQALAGPGTASSAFAGLVAETLVPQIRSLAMAYSQVPLTPSSFQARCLHWTPLLPPPPSCCPLHVPVTAQGGQVRGAGREGRGASTPYQAASASALLLHTCMCASLLCASSILPFPISPPYFAHIHSYCWQ